MPKISQLAPEDFERIAAGEVIERPASVVKELLENAIDAGATRVQVDIGDGGQKWIRVSDNGEGMGADDLRLAVLPHATSKIKSFHDIERVRSLGFRGEALASMAAVGKLKLVSTPLGGNSGHEITVQGGEIISEAPAPRAQGSTFELTYLFFNTPARRKFLKSAKVEFGYIYETVLRYGFGYPNLSLRLDHNGEKLLEVGAKVDLESRMRQLLPQLRAARFVPVHIEAESGMVQGIYVAPSHSYHNRNRQYFFLNHRYIKDQAMGHAVDRFFADRVPRGRFPVLALELNMDPGAFDVNVHPAKIEVRFRSPRDVHHLVTMALESTVSAVSAPAPDQPAPAGEVRQAVIQTTATEPGHEAPVPGDMPRPEPQARAERPETKSQDRKPKPPLGFGPGGAEQFASLMSQETLFQLPVGKLTVLGQVGTGMIVAYDNHEIHFIDGHALHERFLYDQLMAAKGPQSAQMLLVPVRIELDPVTIEKIIECAGELKKMGFDVEAFGDDSVAVRSAPMAIPRESMFDVLNEFFGGFKSYSTSPTVAVMARDLATAACKRAVVFGRQLLPAELRRLVETYEQGGVDMTCPHGRPVAHRIPISLIKKKFQR